jgi:putative ABC transport system permease protein
VLRAIGATTRAVMTIVVSEGVLVAALSWLLAVALSLPLSQAIGNFAGRIFVHADLERTLSVPGLLGWLGLALLIGLVSAVAPAAAAARQSVAKSLQYE